MKQKALHKVHVNSAKIWGIKIEFYLTAEVPMGINIDQPRVQRNRYQMTPSTRLGWTLKERRVRFGGGAYLVVAYWWCKLLKKA